MPSLRVPPPEIPVINFLSPNKSDQGAVEFWNTEVASYVPLDIGAPHPNSRQYPNFRLGKQSPVQGDEKWYLRIWISDETNPDWFNWANKFAGEDAEFPTFIRTYREPRATYAPRTKGEPLGTLYKLVVTDGGSGYANGLLPIVRFDAPTVAPTTEATAHGVVAPDGTISECVLDFGGDGYSQDVEFNVDAPVNGNPASGIAYVQLQIAILTREEASLYPEDSPFYAQYLQVTRIYETIPGPTFYETSLDIDGATLTTATTRKLCADISTGEVIDTGVWCKTTKKPTDIDVICEEVVVCRTLPGNDMVSTVKDEDGLYVTKTQTYIDSSTGISGETLPSTTWFWKYIQDVDGTNLVSWQWVESRAVPGQEIDAITYPYGSNGRRVTATTMVKRATYARTANGTANSNFASALLVDEKLEPVNDSLLVAKKVGIYDEIPVAANQQGLGYFVEYPYDGDDSFPRLTWRFQILRLSATTVTDLSACPISGFTSLKLVDQKTEEADELIEVKVARTYEILPGKAIEKTTIDDAGDTVTETRTKVEASTITTTITTAGGVYTKTFEEPIGGLVAWKVVQVKATQNELDSFEVSIPDLIPREFSGALPVTETEQTLIGDAVLPSLSAGDLMRREAQIDFNTYRLTIRGRAGLSFPQTITNQETTEEYGGGILNVTLTLDDSPLTVDEGLLVVSSETITIGGGLYLKTTKELDGAAWPELVGTHVDEKYGIAIGIERQVVDAGTLGGGGGNVITEVRPIDVWRSIQITSTLDPDSLPDDVVTYAGMHYSFPPELTDEIIDWAEATCGCSDSFSAVLIANMNQYSGTVSTRVTEQFYNGPPPDDVTVTQFFPQAHHFGYAWSSFCGDDDGNCRTKSGAPEFHIPLCLHDDLRLCIGNVGCTVYSALWTFAATTPSALPHGDYIMIPPRVERWRFGVFRRVLTEVLVP